MTSSEKIVNDKSTVISPSNDWILANVTLSAKLSAVRSNGEFFTIENEKSIDLLEYVKNKAHTHEMGGVSMKINAIAREFYQSPHVKDVYSLKKDSELQIYLVLKHDVEDIALHLATLQNAIQRSNKEIYIEIDYATEEDTHLEELTNDYAKVSRG